MFEKPENHQLVTKLLTAVVMIIIAAIYWLFSANIALSAKVARIDAHYVNIQVQLSQIQTDLSWLKSNIPR